MKNGNINKILQILILTLLVAAFIGCNLTAESSAKNENSVKQTEIKTETTPKPTPKIDAKLFGINLIKNGGAETGDASDWMSAGDNLKTFRYDGGWGDVWQVTPPNHGDSYFYATVSKDLPDAVFTQNVDVSKIAAEIDAGKTIYNLRGWFGVRHDTAARLLVTFYGANKSEIKKSQTAIDATEEITEKNSPDDTTMVEKTGTGEIPAGTRSIKITFKFSLFRNRTVDENDTAIADNLLLILTDKGDK